MQGMGPTTLAYNYRGKEETASSPEPAVGVRETNRGQQSWRAAWQRYLLLLLFCEWKDLPGNLCLDLEELIGLRNPWVGEALAFLVLGVAVSSAIDLRYSTEYVEAEEICCAEELDFEWLENILSIFNTIFGNWFRHRPEYLGRKESGT